MRALPNLRRLRYLVALADHLHFGRAAEACAVTQATLSAGIQELEALLRVPLAEQTKRSVILTSVGHRIVARTRQLLRDAEGIMDVAARAASLVRPVCRPTSVTRRDAAGEPVIEDKGAP